MFIGNGNHKEKLLGLIPDGDGYDSEYSQTLAKAAEYIQDLENLLFARGEMQNPPCFCCGYSGPGYYKPDIHPCADRHHELYNDD